MKFDAPTSPQSESDLQAATSVPLLPDAAPEACPPAVRGSMTIGALAAHAGTPISTVRFYEKRGLLGPPARTSSGYRIYKHDDVTRVRFIKRGQELGFTLDELKRLLHLTASPAVSREQLEQYGRDKVDEITAKISDLQRMLGALEGLMQSSHFDPTAPCPIVASLG